TSQVFYLPSQSSQTPVALGSTSSRTQNYLTPNPLIVRNSNPVYLANRLQCLSTRKKKLSRQNCSTARDAALRSSIDPDVCFHDSQPQFENIHSQTQITLNRDISSFGYKRSLPNQHTADSAAWYLSHCSMDLKA